MNVGLISNTFSGITGGQGAISSAKSSADSAKFSDLIKSIQNKNQGQEMGEVLGTGASASVKSTLSSEQIAQNGRLNGDYTSGFSGTFSSQKDKASMPTGAAANQANPHVKSQTIDRTSELYEKSMELESYFVKQMLSAMRKTVMKSQESDFAQQTYEDMLYDEYATSMTKNAGFGLADQIYLSLV